MARGLNGSTQFMSQNSAWFTVPAFTMACWFYPTDDTVVQTLMNISATDDDDCHRIDYRGGEGAYPLQIRSQNAPSYGVAESSAGAAANAWHHACGVVSSTTGRDIYLDGANKVSDVTSVANGNLDVSSIGAWVRGSATAYYFAGRIAEAAIWNIGLPDWEIRLLALGYRPFTVFPQNLVAYWPFIRGSNDLLGTHVLTENGSPTVVGHPPMIYSVSPQVGQVITAVPSGTIFASSVLNSAIFSSAIVR